MDKKKPKKKKIPLYFFYRGKPIKIDETALSKKQLVNLAKRKMELLGWGLVK